MNKELKNRDFDLPQNILDKINHTVTGLNGQNVHGVMRAKKLLTDKKVTYGQLKRIIHDIQGMDKVADKIRYDLAGGELMDRWSKQYLQGERDMVSNRKDGRKQADDIGGITGERKNSHLKKHSKKPDFLPPLNMMKSNSHKSSISSIKLSGLFEQLQRIKATRDSNKVKEKLEKLVETAKTGQGNLLEIAIEAARYRATLGEISDALETVFGRYKAQIKSFSGVYSKEIKDDSSFEKAKLMADEFAKQEGRRPRIMIAKMGQDGHDRGAKVVATGYADVGFDVDIGPLFQTPAEAAKQAIENDVHILGVSSLAAGHKTLVPQVIEELKKYGREDIMVVVGGVIPAQDYQFLFDAGAVAIFGPGTKISDAAIKILEILIQ